MAINQNLAQILAARYGRDVRQAIHDSIEECYTAASFNSRGVYNPNAVPPYSMSDVVYDNGGSYRYIHPTPSNTPTSSASHWQQIASMGGQDLVDAAVAARDAAQGYKDAAANSAAQLQAGIGSPAGAYDDLAALNADNPAHDRTYLTRNDWKIALWDETAGAFVAGGVYQATAISDGSVAYAKLTKGGRFATIIPPTNLIPDYNTSTKILDFKSTLGAEPTLVYGLQTYVIPAGTTVSLEAEWSTTFKLLFDTVTKTFRSVMWNVVPSEDDVIVAVGRNTTGNMWIGCNYTINGEFFTKSETKTIPSTFVGKTKTMDSVNVSNQGLTVVGDEVWGFFPSLADHSNSANIYRWSVDGFDKKTNNFTHNLGHCASADYNAETDVLLTGNGESDNAVLPRIDLTVGVRALCGEDAHALDIANAISIPFFTMSGETIVKQIGGAGCIACFGEEKSIVYVMTAQSAPRKIFRIQLGMGAVDYSDTVGTDVTKWGTFIPGKTADEYNGTAKVLATYTGAEATVSQGLCFHDGHLFLCCGYTVPQILKIKCLDNGTYEIVEKFELEEYNSSGVRISHEPEGVCVYKGVYLLIGVMGAPKRMLIFPLYNKQVGKGTVGTRVVFDFPCNSVPTVMITPTTSTTDLYISNIDRLGFTVSSASEGSGTFNWECPIS